MRLMPGVATIETFSGGIPDTRYERVEDGEWTAYVRRGFATLGKLI